MTKTPKRLAVVYRTVRPEDGVDGFAAFLIGTLLDPNLSDSLIRALYEEYAPGRFNLNDRGYLAGVHPLELWLLAHKSENPRAELGEVFRASGPAIEDSYTWLFLPRNKRAQDRGIRVMLEIDAFQSIHREWQRQGYPFRWLVPSLATSIGTSGDTPAALATLVGAIASGGIAYPNVKITDLHFAEGTPYETRMSWRPAKGEQVFHPEVAAVAHRELVGVVEQGTGRRAAGLTLIGDRGRIEIGGKTGTGDNRYKVFSSGGGVVESRVVNRTATFVFLLGDRHFGTITAFVPGEAAAAYNFTSSLPVQIFRDLAPMFSELAGAQPTPSAQPAL
jgi:hypothetical protein